MSPSTRISAPPSTAAPDLDGETDLRGGPACSLATIVEQRGSLPLEEAAAILARVGRAVAREHEWGRVFGWLHPEGVILLGSEEVRLEAPDAGSVERPEDWQAPEWRATGEADTRADIYTLGCLFRYLLTGRPHGRLGRMPEELEAFCSRAQEERPEERFQSVALLVRRAEELAEEGEALGRAWRELNVSVRERVADRVRRFAGRQWAALCLALVLAGLVGALGWQYWQRSRAAAERRRRLREIAEEAQGAYRTGQLRKAEKAYQYLLEQTDERSRRGPALRRLIEIYRALGDKERERQALLTYLGEFPQSTDRDEYEARLVELTAEAVATFGGVKPIGTERTFIVDGLAEDWEGFEPLLVDKPRDAGRKNEAADIVAFYAAATAEDLVVRIDTLEPPAETEIAYTLGVDTDPRTFTDTPQDWDWEIGFHPTIPDWIWDLRAGRTWETSESVRLPGTRFAAGRVVEASFPLGAINRPRLFSLRVKTYDTRRRRDVDELDRKVIVSIAPPAGDRNGPEEPDGSEETDEAAAAAAATEADVRVRRGADGETE
jgi:tetratricopeptide (TPR) repeat protein